jgi:amidohydrolase
MTPRQEVDEGGGTLDCVVDVPLGKGPGGSAVVSGLPIESAYGDGWASDVGSAELKQLLLPYAAELVEFRRDLHAHPELGRAEVRTTAQVRERLTRAGLAPVMLPGGTGLLCDIGGDSGADVGGGDRLVALRADLDALPVPDDKDVSYRSTVPGACHACGHDVHTAVLVGAALVLGDLHRRGRLPGGVRCVFQPAEESTPGGALDVIAAGGLDKVERIFALHCDPRADVGELGIRVGAITAAADSVTVRLSGPGGHTARPHLTADLVYALGRVVTEVPSALTRRVDPRAVLSLVWGRISAGSTANAIPEHGMVQGTVRCHDIDAWERAPDLIREVATSVAAAYGVTAEVEYSRGVPPVVNDADSAEMLAAAGRMQLGEDGVVATERSLGGEDFGWYLDRVPGALGRLGVRRPGDQSVRDLHQGVFDVDERAIGLGVRVLVATALRAHG